MARKEEPAPRAPRKCIGYVRCSTEEQARSGLGLDEQRRDIRDAAKRLRLPLADEHVFTDGGLSGSLEMADRPALLQALGALSRGDVLIVAKRDRIARDMYVVVMIERELARTKCRLVSAAGEGTEDDSPESILMRRIFDGVAEYVRLQIKLRTKQALARKRERGEKIGGCVPYGWRIAGWNDRGKPTLEHCPKEQRVLQKIRLWLQGGHDGPEILRRLDGLGVVARRGKPFSRRMLWRTIQRLRLREAA